MPNTETVEAIKTTESFGVKADGKRFYHILFAVFLFGIFVFLFHGDIFRQPDMTGSASVQESSFTQEREASVVETQEAELPEEEPDPRERFRVDWLREREEALYLTVLLLNRQPHDFFHIEFFCAENEMFPEAQELFLEELSGAEKQPFPTTLNAASFTEWIYETDTAGKQIVGEKEKENAQDYAETLLAEIEEHLGEPVSVRYANMTYEPYEEKDRTTMLLPEWPYENEMRRALFMEYDDCTLVASIYCWDYK